MDTLISFFIQTSFLWLPVLLGVVFWHFWVEWRHDMYRSTQKWTLLEISIPKDVFKSPEAMEVVLNTLNEGSGMSTLWKKYVSGNVPHEFSLELVSIEGTIYFFIRTQEKFKDLIKNQVYSQYPQAEIHEVDDYTRYVGDYTRKQDTWDMFGVEFALINKDAFPIKTYVDYGLDRAVGTLEEWQKIDPLTPVLEFLGSLKQNEQIWIQMVIRMDKWSDWRKDAMEQINKIMGRKTKGKMPGTYKAVSEEIAFFASGKNSEDKPKEEMSVLKLTHGEQEQIKAIERSLQKHAFEVGFRAMYLARKDTFRPSNIAGLIGSVRQYNSPYLNGFKPGLTTDYDYKYQDITGLRLPKLKRKFFDNYITRSFFYGAALDSGEKPKKPFVLTTEELATMFRFPGRVSETSSLERIEATKSQAPSNLPI